MRLWVKIPPPVPPFTDMPYGAAGGDSRTLVIKSIGKRKNRMRKTRDDVPEPGDYDVTLDAYGENKAGELVVRAVIDSGRYAGSRVSTVVAEENREKALRYLEGLTPKVSRFRIGLTRQIFVMIRGKEHEVGQMPENAANMRVRYWFTIVNTKPRGKAQYRMQTRQSKFVRR